VTETKEQLLTKLGFRFGVNGPHAARTMMLDDLRELFRNLPQTASRDEYLKSIAIENVLGKPTKKARELAGRHLCALYALDTKVPLFRVMRKLWDVDEQAQPVLALTVALARDPLLRGTEDFILSKHPGELVTREDLEQLLERNHPGRFSPASLKSFAQNVNGTWTSAGFLVGRIRKTRAVPVITPANVVLSLAMGHLQGLTGQRLFASSWMRLLSIYPDEAEALVTAASHRGLLLFLNAGGVKEVRFPDYVTPEEELVRQEVSLVV